MCPSAPLFKYILFEVLIYRTILCHFLFSIVYFTDTSVTATSTNYASKLFDKPSNMSLFDSVLFKASNLAYDAKIGRYVPIGSIGIDEALQKQKQSVFDLNSTGATSGEQKDESQLYSASTEQSSHTTHNNSFRQQAQQTQPTQQEQQLSLDQDPTTPDYDNHKLSHLKTTLNASLGLGNSSLGLNESSNDSIFTNIKHITRLVVMLLFSFVWKCNECNERLWYEYIFVNRFTEQ